MVRYYPISRSVCSHQSRAQRFQPRPNSTASLWNGSSNSPTSSSASSSLTRRCVQRPLAPDHLSSFVGREDSGEAQLQERLVAELDGGHARVRQPGPQRGATLVGDLIAVPDRFATRVIAHADQAGVGQATELGIDAPDARAPVEPGRSLDLGLDRVSRGVTLGDHAEDDPGGLIERRGSGSNHTAV